MLKMSAIYIDKFHRFFYENILKHHMNIFEILKRAEI